MTQTIVYTLICINVVTFVVYGIDKWKAKKGSWRILSRYSLSIIITPFTSLEAIPQRQTSSRHGMFPLLKNCCWNIPFQRTESDISSTSREISTDWSILLLIPRLRNGWSYIRRSMATEIIGYVLKRCSSKL